MMQNTYSSPSTENLEMFLGTPSVKSSTPRWGLRQSSSDYQITPPFEAPEDILYVDIGGTIGAAISSIRNSLRNIETYAFVENFVVPTYVLASQEIDAANNRLIEELRKTLLHAKEEYFEDGYESEFSVNLQRLVYGWGEKAIEALGKLIKDGYATDDVAREVMLWMGYIKDTATHHARRLMLESFITDESYYIKDGAIIGLDALSDILSIPTIEAALEREEIPEFQQDLRNLLEQLKSGIG